ncbi:MAG: sigma-70 family RNA polymerase sigma factor [Planctomycetales bacterium]|nr:sigma-70 family RNA polymerase sigma factor [Planctomycetales bacterium]
MRRSKLRFELSTETGQRTAVPSTTINGVYCVLSPDHRHDDSTSDLTPASSLAEDGKLARLIESAQNGDQAAVGELLEAYRNYLRAIARRRMSSPVARRVDPSDVVQQTMLEAHQGIHGLLTNDQTHLRAKLRKILQCNVANAVRDHLCAQKRRIDREHPDCDNADQHPGRLTTPSMTLAKQESMHLFGKVIDQLPDDQAIAIRMRYFEYASVGEIGETLGRSRVAAAGLLKRGLIELRKRMGAFEA